MIPWGIAELDELVGEIPEGSLVALAGPTAMGKTALATNLALHAALESNVPVGILSSDHDRELIVTRLLCQRSHVSLSRLYRGRLTDEDYVRLASAAGELNTADIHIGRLADLNPHSVRSDLDRFKATCPNAALAVVDQLPFKASNRFAAALKVMARQLRMPVIVTADVSPRVSTRLDKRPCATDVADSIEMHADMVLVIYRREYWLHPIEAIELGVTGVAELYVVKNRFGPCRVVRLHFDRESLVYSPLPTAA
jgi:replicative DNA helicase